MNSWGKICICGQGAGKPSGSRGEGIESEDWKNTQKEIRERGGG